MTSQLAYTSEMRSVVERAKNARARHAKKRMYNRRKAERYRDPTLDLDVCPVLTVRQWEVLFALELGALRTSHYTVAGATVAHRSAEALDRLGLVARDRGFAQLTERGRLRVERGW